MKVKRYKRAQRMLTIFRYNFGFIPPYRILLDGTFAMAALQNKINLREQMPKYLNEEVEMCVTKCVLNELEKLGPDLYGALHICKQFTVDPCPHEPMRSASACISHMARRMKTKTKYFIATQDNELTETLRSIPGIPILFIKYKGILIDKVSTATLQEIDRPKDPDIVAIKAIKKAISGEEVKKKRKKRGGPNPLSVKKKKRTVVHHTIGKDTGTIQKHRHHKKKRKSTSNNDGNVQVPDAAP